MLASLLALFLLALPRGPGQDAPPLSSGLVRQVEVGRRVPAFVQHFRLDAGEPQAELAPLGLLRYVAGPEDGGGIHVELELELFAADLRLIHVEQESVFLRRLVYRELGAHHGRTLFLEGEPAGVLLGYELGGPEVVRRATDAGGLLPLVFLETLRRGAEPPSELRVLEPLSANFEPLRIDASSQESARVLEARRADGSLRWRVRLQGSELSELAFQERGPLARAISPDEFERLRERHERETRAASEAAARRSRPWDALLDELPGGVRRP
jgi:hypothetical protein